MRPTAVREQNLRYQVQHLPREARCTAARAGFCPSRKEHDMISLVINPDSVRISKSTLSTHVFSEIYFQLPGGTFFPEEKWDDFSTIILGWWLEEAISLTSDRESTFNFMDGPYYVEAKPIDQSCELSFITNRGDKKQIIHCCRMETSTFLKILISSANLLIRHLPVEAKAMKDSIELNKKMTLLQRHMREA